MVIKGDHEMMKISDYLFTSNNVELTESKIMTLLQPIQQFKNTPKQKSPVNLQLKIMTSPQDEELMNKKYQNVHSNQEEDGEKNYKEENPPPKVTLKSTLGLMNCDPGASPTFSASERLGFK